MSGFHPKDLIKEVKIRPGIYNRDELVHPKRDHKHQLWMEVAERLTPPEDWESYSDVEKEARMDEIATKWKHLKDHFYREIKLQEAGEAHKKRKYIYFDDLEFMRPYVGFKLAPINKRNKVFESLDNTQEYTDNDADIDMDAFLKSTEQVEEDGEYKMEPSNSTSDEQPKLKRMIKPTPKALQNKTYCSSLVGRQNIPVNKNFNALRKSSAAPTPHLKIRDGDISFSLSLVPTLRKLSDGLKLRAKIDILKILQRCVDDAEQQNSSVRPNVANQSTKSSIVQVTDIDDDMAEDHLEDYEENVNIKHEQHDDPLNGGSGDNKTWWT